MSKPYHKSKTMQAVAIQSSLGSLLLALPEVRDAIPPTYYVIGFLLCNGIFGYLRSITTGPVGKADE